MPASFEDQLAVVAELLREVARMEKGEKRHSARPSPDSYERDLRLAGLAQRIAQAYTIIEGVLAFVARLVHRAPRAVRLCAARQFRELGNRLRFLVANFIPVA